MQQLIAHGADVHIVAANGFSPLYIATASDYLECARLLINNGAIADQQLLLVAVGKGHKEIVDLLMTTPTLSEEGGEEGSWMGLTTAGERVP
jgi:ankyrin repeat protein